MIILLKKGENMLTKNEVFDGVKEIIESNPMSDYTLVSVLDIQSAINNHFAFYFNSLDLPNEKVKIIFNDLYRNYCKERCLTRLPKIELLKLNINSDDKNDYVYLTLKDTSKINRIKEELNVCYMQDKKIGNGKVIETKDGIIYLLLKTYVEATLPLIKDLINYDKEYKDIIKNNKSNKVEYKYKLYNAELLLSKYGVLNNIAPNLEEYSEETYYSEDYNHEGISRIISLNEQNILSKSMVPVKSLPENIQKYYEDYEIKSIQDLISYKRKKR